ncbi:unnamed protein product [Lathyrus sativus]|nr:unnamed protein product [Lathyrus sativus]
MNQREGLVILQQVWDNTMLQQKFKIKPFYAVLNKDIGRVDWRNLIKYNKARPRVFMCLWLTCHGNISTKDRLKRFGMVQDSLCGLCKMEEESLNRSFFYCSKTKGIWSYILKWVKVNHVPHKWDDKLRWIISVTKGKGRRVALMKMIVTETIYCIWSYRNDVVFDNTVNNNSLVTKIIDSVVYRG